MIIVDIPPRPTLDVEIRARPNVDIDVGDTVVVAGRVPAYDGPYEITPSEEAQTLPTAGTRLENCVVVAPIPTNYGRITWDGSTITIT